MSAMEHKITRNDILPPATYAAQRKEQRAKMMPVKATRRIEVGPYATFYFENYDTMWLQVHEMLHIEKGGDAQIADELSAYNPLIPQGQELVATLMFEIDDPVRRLKVLRSLTHVEEHLFFEVDGERVMADAEDEVERTAADGKTSSVHFLHFRFTPAQIEKFKAPNAKIVLGCDHENYGHMAQLSAPARTALAADFA